MYKLFLETVLSQLCPFQQLKSSNHLCAGANISRLELKVKSQSQGACNIHALHFYSGFYSGRGIVFTHGVWMCGWMGRCPGGLQEKICLGCISETIRCRKLTLCRDIG